MIDQNLPSLAIYKLVEHNLTRIISSPTNLGDL